MYKLLLSSYVSWHLSFNFDRNAFLSMEKHKRQKAETDLFMTVESANEEKCVTSCVNNKSKIRKMLQCLVYM